MRKRFGLVGLVLVAGLLVAGAMPVRAAEPVSYDDPAGDQLDARPSMDILKVAYDVKQVNKGGPPSIVVEITLAAPPEAQLVNYTANGDAGGDCYVDVSYRPGTVLSQTHGIPAAQFWIGCGDAGELVAAKTLIKGNVITMSTALDSIPKTIRENGELTGLSATSEIAEPVTGIVGTAIIGGADEATTDKTFRYA